MDNIVHSVMKKLADRSLRGQMKYGCTLERDDLSDAAWLVHLQEELMDASCYIERILANMEKK